VAANTPTMGYDEDLIDVSSNPKLRRPTMSLASWGVVLSRPCSRDRPGHGWAVLRAGALSLSVNGGVTQVALRL
jgi:hypothetical protein